MAMRDRLWDPTRTEAYVDDEAPGVTAPQSSPDNNRGGDKDGGNKDNGTKLPETGYPSYTGFSYNPYVRGGFSYKDAPEYINRYQAQIDDLSNRILHAQGFNYNYNADPLYQQYAEAYNRNGQNAMRNTLAQMAARTGGMASSYAGTAAQNTYNGYMQELNDKVPELYQLAYGMYNDRINKQRNDLSMLEALEQGDYAKYADLLGQYNTDRNLAYNVWNAQESARESADRANMQYAYNVWKAQQDAKANESSYKAQIKALQDAVNSKETKNDSEGSNGGSQEEAFSSLKDLYYRMKQSGASNKDIQDEIDNAYNAGLINSDEAGSLKVLYNVNPLTTFNYGDWLNARVPGSSTGGDGGGVVGKTTGKAFVPSADEFEGEDAFRQDTIGNKNDMAAYYSLLENYKDDPETYRALLENYLKTGR